MSFVRNMIRANKNAIRNFLEEKKFRKYSLYRYMAKASFASSVDFANQYLKGARRFNDRKSLIKFCLDQAKSVNIRDGLYLEFGVYKGESLKLICELVGEHITVHGFDSFEGLPEDWGVVLPKGAFSLKKLPKVPRNAILHKGWFSESLQKFVGENKKACQFIHIDCDLYQSTKDVLHMLGNQIVPGTVILFDEYINIVDWENHEYKAFTEFCGEKKLNYEYIAFNSEQTLGAGTEVAIKITQ